MSEMNGSQNQDWRAQKEAERKETMHMINDAAFEIMLSPVRFKNYLKLQGMFDRYSVANVLLINKQKPGATKLKDFKSWSEEGRKILKGEKGINIIQPEKYQKQDGTEGISYNVKKVFDVSQVTGIEREAFRNKPQRIADVLLKTCPFPVQEAAKLDFESNGVYYDENQKTLFVVSSEKGKDYFCQYLALEIGFAEVQKRAAGMPETMANFQAKCIACEVCSRYGQDTQCFEFDDIPSEWRDLESKKLRSVLDDIRADANRIIARGNEVLYHKEKEAEAR